MSNNPPLIEAAMNGKQTDLEVSAQVLFRPFFVCSGGTVPVDPLPPLWVEGAAARHASRVDLMDAVGLADRTRGGFFFF